MPPIYLILIIKISLLTINCLYLSKNAYQYINLNIGGFLMKKQLKELILILALVFLAG